MVIGLDFDGTCVSNEFPRVGFSIGAAPVLRELIKQGHQIILLTMRSDVLANPDGTPANPQITKISPGYYLNDAITWFKRQQIQLSSVNRNAFQESFTTSTKVFCDLYIDDANLGALLTKETKKPYLNWVATLAKLRMHEVIKMEQENFEHLLQEVINDINSKMRIV